IRQLERAIDLHANVVAGDRVVARRVGEVVRVRSDVDAVAAVAGDDVEAGPVRSDGVVVGSAGNQDAVVAIGNGNLARLVRADLIAGDIVVIGVVEDLHSVAAGDFNPIVGVPGNH